MKKGVSLALVLALVLGLTACSTGGDDTRSIGSPSPAMENPAADTETPSAPETITITSLSADKEAAELGVPYDPQHIAVLGMTSPNILDALDVAGGRVVGSAGASLGYLQSYVTSENMVNLDIIKAADLEAVMVAQPDVIFIDGRLARSYDALNEIAPVVYLTTDSELNTMKSIRQDAATIASMFGLEDKVDKLTAGFDVHIRTLADFAADKTAIVGMYTSGGFNVLDNDGRYSIIDREISLENIGADAGIDTSIHSNKASFEFVMKGNPGHIFVMDRGAAIQTDGAQLAQEIMKNELVMGTGACKNGNVAYLAHPAIWYTVKSGITALDIILQDPESKLLG